MAVLRDSGLKSIVCLIASYKSAILRLRKIGKVLHIKTVFIVIKLEKKCLRLLACYRSWDLG